MDLSKQFLTYIDSYLSSAQYYPFLLIGTGLFFTFYLKFPQIRYFKHALRIVTGKYDKPSSKGDVTHYQALTTALSGTLGTSNIGGVALAVYLGGPAALFWMWITAFFGMTTKFVEVSLSHKYRSTDENGLISGGPMYYMEKGLKLKWLAVFFAVATVITALGAGNMPQSNNMVLGIESTFGISPLITGLVLSVILGLVIVRGIKTIVKFTEKIIPTVAIVYFIGALSVIFVNLEQIGPSFLAIFSNAFTGSAAAGGFLGASFAFAFNRGVNRGLFSNEAGMGSAPIAHAAAKTDQPVSEGMVSILEPFIDTIVICTLTGLVILSSGVWTEKFENEFQTFDMEYIVGDFDQNHKEHQQLLYNHLNFGNSRVRVASFSGTIEIVQGKATTDNFTIIHNRSIAEKVIYSINEAPYTGNVIINDGYIENSDLIITGHSLLHSVALTVKAFTRGAFGKYGQYIVSIGLLLFAFSTVVAWSYYGDRAITYLFGVKWIKPYRYVYIFCFFIAAISDTSLIWIIATIATALMTLPNLIAILLLRKEMKLEVNNYWKKFDEN